MMIIISVYTVFGNAYVSAFGVPTDLWYVYFDIFVEGMFFFDIIFSFFQEYMDEETFVLQKRFRIIAKHYLRRSFIFDLIAWIPISLILDKNYPHYPFYYRACHLLKLFRLPRLAQLLDVDKCKSLLNEYYNKKLNKSVQQNNSSFHFPI